MRALTIPEGTLFEQLPQGIRLCYKGDICLEECFTFPISAILAGGNIEISKSFALESMKGSSITLHSPVQVQHIETSRLVLHQVFIGEELHLKGPMELHGNIKIKRLFIEGNISIHGNLQAETCIVNGSLNVDGELRAALIVVNEGNLSVRNSAQIKRAIVEDGTVSLNDESSIVLLRAKTAKISCLNAQIRALRVSSELSIDDGNIVSEVVIAPKVSFHPQLQGRIMALESSEDLGPHMVKGCLSFADLGALIPDSDQFLQQREVQTDLNIDEILSEYLLDGHSDQTPKPHQESKPRANPKWSDKEENLNKEASAVRIILEESLDEHSDDDSSLELSASKIIIDSYGVRNEEEDNSDLDSEDLSEDSEDSNEVLPTAPFKSKLALKLPSTAVFDEPDSEDLEDILQENADEPKEDLAGEQAAVIVHNTNFNTETLPTTFIRNSIPEDDYTQSEEQESGLRIVSDDSYEFDDIITPISEEGDLEESSIIEPLSTVEDDYSSIEGNESEEWASMSTIKEDIEEEITLMNSSPPKQDEITLEHKEDIFPEPENDPIYNKLKDDLNTILSCYDDPPPPIRKLRDMIRAQEYAILQDEVRYIWSQIIRYHTQHGTAVPPFVIVAFNRLNTNLR